MKKLFEGSDLLVISDFQLGCLSRDVQELIAGARADSMEFYAVGIDDWWLPRNRKDKSEIPEYFCTGYDFFYQCDHKFIYTNGGLEQLEINNKTKLLTPR